VYLAKFDAGESSRQLGICHQETHSLLRLEPLIYEHVTLVGEPQFEKFYRTFRKRRHSTTKNRAFFQRNVHTLFIGVEYPLVEKARKIVRELTGLRSLACWNRAWRNPALSVILDSAPEGVSKADFPYKHLQRISFSALLLVERGITFTHRAFRDLTHMDIYYRTGVNWESLRCLPNLTHLSLDMATYLPTPASGQLSIWFSRILDACPPTAKIVIFAVVDERNTDFDLLDSEGDYFLPGWPPGDFSTSVVDGEEWAPWLTSESGFSDNTDLDVLHPISRLALGLIDPRAVAGAVTEVPQSQLFRDLLLFFIYPNNMLDWDGRADQHRDCWTVAEDIVKKRQGLTYARLVNQLSS
jgi:hypothetical protein